jgi:RNA polymerase sigma-70 factor, ECF subfamily
VTPAIAIEQESHWMLAFQAGDTAGFELLLEKYQTPVAQYLWRYVHNNAVAEDLAQDVFLRVYRSRNYKPSAKFRTWLFCIATNVALNWIRDERHASAMLRLDEEPERGKRREVRAWSPNVEESLVREATLASIRAAIAALPEKQRAAVLMHKYEDMDYREIAQVLDCSVSAVKSLLWRAYDTLRAELAHFAPAPAAPVSRAA